MGDVQRADLLVAVAEDVAQLRVGREQLLVEEGGDGYAVLREDGDGGGDKLALLRGERRRMRQVVAGLDGFGHRVRWYGVYRCSPSSSGLPLI